VSTSPSSPQTSLHLDFNMVAFHGCLYSDEQLFLVGQVHQTGPHTTSPLPTKDKQNFYIQWIKANNIVVGSIKLHLSESLKAKHQVQNNAVALRLLLYSRFIYIHPSSFLSSSELFRVRSTFLALQTLFPFVSELICLWDFRVLSISPLFCTLY